MSDLVQEAIAAALLEDGATHTQVIRETGLDAGGVDDLGIERRPRNRGRLWTEDEVAYIQMHYEDQADEEIADALGRPLRSVQNKRVRLGLLRRDWNARLKAGILGQVLDVIIRYKLANDGNSPSALYLARAVGLSKHTVASQKSQIQGYLDKLERQGKIRVLNEKGRRCGIVVTGATWSPPAWWKEANDGVY